MVSGLYAVGAALARRWHKGRLLIIITAPKPSVALMRI